MKQITEKIAISMYDYEELNSETGRWTPEQYAYWAAKFKTNYAPEGYGLYGARTLHENDGYFITWYHYDSCD